MSKVAVLVCQPDTQIIKVNNADYIAVDGGFHALSKANFTISALIGDLDSIDEYVYSGNIIKYDTMKDETDTYLAIQYAIETGYTKIIIQGVTTHRMDHFLNIIQLLYIFKHVDIEIIDSLNTIFLLQHERTITAVSKYISFFTLFESCMNSEGLLYEFDSYVLTPLAYQTISNQILHAQCTISVTEPIVVILSN